MKGNRFKLLCMAIILSALTATTASAGGSSIQALGSWWSPGDSGSTYGYGLRGTAGIGDAFGIDLGWTYFGEGDDIKIGNNDEIRLGGVDAHTFDFGARYTLPMELYFGGGLTYFAFDHDTAKIDGEWGVYGLVGWSFGGEHVRGFIEGMYRYAEGTVKYDHGFEGHLDNDLDYDGFAANIGIMYRF